MNIGFEFGDTCVFIPKYENLDQVLTQLKQISCIKEEISVFFSMAPREGEVESFADALPGSICTLHIRVEEEAVANEWQIQLQQVMQELVVVVRDDEERDKLKKLRPLGI